jgi:hypothetical protein
VIKSHAGSQRPSSSKLGSTREFVNKMKAGIKNEEVRGLPPLPHAVANLTGSKNSGRVALADIDGSHFRDEEYR